MPLTPDEFEAARRDIEAAVYWLLKDRAPVAFSADEVVFELGAIGVMYQRDAISDALSSLLTSRRIEAVTVGDELYYRYLRQFGFRPPRRS